MQEMLDTGPGHPGPAQAQFRELLAAREPSRVLVTADAAFPAAGVDDAAGLLEWLTASDTSDEAISSLDRLAAALAESHTQVAPGVILAHVRELQVTAQHQLRDGRLRHSQARELLRISGGLLAHQPAVKRSR